MTTEHRPLAEVIAECAAEIAALHEDAARQYGASEEEAKALAFSRREEVLASFRAASVFVVLDYSTATDTYDYVSVHRSKDALPECANGISAFVVEAPLE